MRGRLAGVAAGPTAGRSARLRQPHRAALTRRHPPASAEPARPRRRHAPEGRGMTWAQPAPTLGRHPSLGARRGLRRADPGGQPARPAGLQLQRAGRGRPVPGRLRLRRRRGAAVRGARRRGPRGRGAVHDLVLRPAEGPLQRARAGVDRRPTGSTPRPAWSPTCASADGTLADLEARAGRLRRGRRDMAVITAGRHRSSSTAQFRLQPVDYARIRDRRRAPTSSCPNRETVRGEVTAISVETSDGIAYATVAGRGAGACAVRRSTRVRPARLARLGDAHPARRRASWPGRRTRFLEFLHRVGVR